MKTLSVIVKTVCLVIVIMLPASILEAAQGVVGDLNLMVKGENWVNKQKDNTLIISKEVKAKSPDFELNSERLIVFYAEQSKLFGQEQRSDKIKKIEASENVEIVLPNGFVSHSGKAEYIRETEEIILSEEPVLRSPDNEVRGCVIRYFLEKEIYAIEGCEKKSVQATATLKKD